jgi:hypothetical protein
MPYAFLNPDGTIRDVVRKLAPYMKVGDGERIVGYNPPDIDTNLFAAVAVSPVPDTDAEVTFDVQPLPDDTVWPSIRAQRDALLDKTDWTQMPDVAMSTKQAWAQYRQALRDITQQQDPHNIVWPTPPQ